jgi:N-methylhydantoinase B/oxoprolinase/acetone carboxylase alpha subunit
VIQPGDVLDVRSGGGGGFGDPAERSAEARARDRRLGFVTDGAAEHRPRPVGPSGGKNIGSRPG